MQTCIFARDGKTPDGGEIEAYVDVLRTAGTDLIEGVLLYGLARPSLQPEAPRLAPAPEAAMAEIAARICELGLTVRVSP
ncbi:MAG: radical protein [Proteobacteria bacterium]|nr:radical protein [Pseudomonadota bacterium]